MLNKTHDQTNESTAYAVEEADEPSLQDLISILWDRKWIVIICTLVALALGVFYSWITIPIYAVDALIQIEEKSSGSAELFTDLGELLETASPANAEIEIIKSRLILGRVAKKLNLLIDVCPETIPIIGAALIRDQKVQLDLGKPRFSSLELPQAYLNKSLIIYKKKVNSVNGKEFYIAKDKFVILDGDLPLIEGSVGTPVEGTLNGGPYRVFISDFDAPKAKRYVVTKLSPLEAIERIKRNLSVKEKGKQSGILSLSYFDANPIRGAEILNEICDQYVFQNVERSSEEAEKTLSFLQGQLPGLKNKMEQSEDALNAYRYEAGTVDLSKEAVLMLDQSVSYEAKIFEFEQRREELLRLFKTNHPAVKAVETQIKQLQEEVNTLEESIKKLPKTQQEVLRLSRDAQVNTELYTTLLNNAQQLQIAKAGEIGSVRIIDRAMPTSKPIKPEKTIIHSLAMIIGLIVGCILALLRQFWHKGIEDPKLIEEHLGLPVYATIPHSSKQDRLYKNIKEKKKGLYVLASSEKSDLAMESLRSLRTTLHFSMLEANNNIIMLAGPCPDIGKTFVCVNFAATLAHSGKRVLLLDADMRKGQVNHYFGFQRHNGLSDVLTGTMGIQDAIKKSGIENLWLITTGQLPPNPSELMLQTRLSNCLKEIQKNFDYIVVDAPPILAAADATIIGKFTGTTLLLLKYRHHPIREIETAVKRLNHVGIKVKGTVFNDVSMKSGRRNNLRYGQYIYHYEYGKKKKRK